MQHLCKLDLSTTDRRLPALIPLHLQGCSSSREESKQGSIINQRKSIRSITRRSLLNAFCSAQLLLTAGPPASQRARPRFHLQLLVEHVHGGGLGQQRRSAAVLLQAGQGHPVEGSLVGAFAGGGGKMRCERYAHREIQNVWLDRWIEQDFTKSCCPPHRPSFQQVKAKVAFCSPGLLTGLCAESLSCSSSSSSIIKGIYFQRRLLLGFYKHHRHKSL